MMKKKFIVLLCVIVALSGMLSGCLSRFIQRSFDIATSFDTQLGPPSIDYSLIGPYDSAILFYVDPELNIGRYPGNGTMRYFYIKINPGNLSQEYLVNWTGVQGQEQQCQIVVPNGSFTLHIEGNRTEGNRNYGASDILPIDVSLNDMAITYKIRLATDEEKRAGGVGLGNEAFILEEVAQVKLR